MSEPSIERRAALAQIAERWDADRTERTLGSVQRQLRRRTRRSRVIASGAALGLLGVVAFMAWGSRPSPFAKESVSRPVAAETASAVQNATARSQRMQLADGSEIALLDDDARVVVREVSPSRMALELTSGRAHFEVAHREERVFRVISGEVTVEVLGTAFDLERTAARTRVAVVRGRVAVEWPSGRTVLAAGEAGWFPKAGDDAASELSGLAPNVKHASPKSNPPTSAWREPAERGDFEHAYTLLAQAKRAPLDDVEELLLAADTARLSGHPEAALPFLERVVAHHARDARAPLAAFTLGGVLMQQLGRPREAEAAYARARELSLNSSLAQDALARQVEAAHRAGDAEHAARLAREYVERYPSGRRVHAVRRFGGLPAE